MLNSFKNLNNTDIINFKIKANNIFDKIRKNPFKDNPLIKYESEDIMKIPKYKYYKVNINYIIKEYSKEFGKYGIGFIYVPFKIKKR